MSILTHIFILIVSIVIVICYGNIEEDEGDIKKAEEIVNYQNEVEKWLNQVDKDKMQFNIISAKLSWDMTIGNMNERMPQQIDEVIRVRNLWKNRVCESKVDKKWLTSDQKRKLYLLCRGPKYTEETSKSEMNVMGEMHRCYELKLCFGLNEPTMLENLSSPGQNLTNYPKPGDCLTGEPDLEWLMKRSDFNSDQLKWIWTKFYNPIALCMHRVYPSAVQIQNLVAKANGYDDVGEIWRDELEIHNLQSLVEEMFKEIMPLFKILHGVVRHKLLIKHGPLEIDPTGPIPIHLTGNMWGQNWSALIKLFITEEQSLKLDQRLQAKNWTVEDMVKQAEDFYTSMGFPTMTEKFWKYSIFEQQENLTQCHGTAANLFKEDDYRMLLCAKINMEHFYIIHHEMGHIEYDMAYKDQPTVYQEAANSAFHETIGDVIMHGVMVPQHLYRLSLLNDNELIDENVNLQLLLEQALGKIAEIPFSFIIDNYRWNIFNENISPDEYNKVYWKMNEEIRGIVPPEKRSEMYMDAGAKFHLPDNTPYIRYFLSSILQMQIFKGLCEISLYGRFRNDEETLSIPLHRCDIYGCKKCGRIMKEAMSLGASVHWSQILEMLSGKSYITTRPLLEYYNPIYNWLNEYIERFNIPVGW